MSFFDRFKRTKTEPDEPRELTANDLEELLNRTGLKRTLQVTGSAPRVLWRNFTNGIVWGMGYFLGLTVGVALLLWMMRSFVDFPLIGEYAEKLIEIIDNYNPVSS